MTPRTLIWKANGRAKPLRNAGRFDRLQRDEPYTGSVTLFTNGGTVDYSSLTVSGELDPGWVEEQILSRAVLSLREIEPEYPFGPGG